MVSCLGRPSKRSWCNSEVTKEGFCLWGNPGVLCVLQREGRPGGGGGGGGGGGVGGGGVGLGGGGGVGGGRPNQRLG